MAASIVPAFKRYVVEMRFKPMPRYEQGAVAYSGVSAIDRPVGRQFIQPRVDTRAERDVLLDEVLGSWFSVVSWNNDPLTLLGEEAARWLELGARFISLRPSSQLNWRDHDHPDLQVVADATGALKRWFDEQEASVLFLRPDRFVAAACVAQRAPEVSRALADALSLSIAGTRPVLPTPATS
jgi:3-(3-hydroxy-phenyl)propionate hydroxylase